MGGEFEDGSLLCSVVSTGGCGKERAVAHEVGYLRCCARVEADRYREFGRLGRGLGADERVLRQGGYADDIVVSCGARPDPSRRVVRMRDDTSEIVQQARRMRVGEWIGEPLDDLLTGRPEFLDIGLTYGLLNLIGTLAVLKFFRRGDLAYDDEEKRDS